MSSSKWWMLCVGLTAACGGHDEKEFEPSVAELRHDLRVEVEILGTTSPYEERRVLVTLMPGASIALDDDSLCEIVRASVTLNGLPMNQRGEGGYSTYGCNAIWYDLPVDDELRARLQKDGARIVVADETDSVAIESDDFLARPGATISAPAPGVLVPGGLLDVRSSPESVTFPGLFHATYVADDTSSFRLPVVESEPGKMVFSVPLDAKPSTGRVEIKGDGHLGTFGMTPSRCDATACIIARSVCFDARECRHGVAYGNGFDTLVLDATVLSMTAP